jgi:hypothetical protein
MAGLDPPQRRLVCLFAEALLLAQDGENDVGGRLRLLERTFDMSLYTMRRRAKSGCLGPEDLSALDSEFGVSPIWVLEGDSRALAQRIVTFCKIDPIS